MLKYRTVLFLFFFQQSVPAISQCISRDSLLNRLDHLRDFPSLDLSQQLTELLKYESNATLCKYDVDSVWPSLLHRIGSTYYKLSDYSHSEIYTRRAIHAVEILKARYNSTNRILVRCYFTLASIYQIQNKFLQKANAQDSCLAIAIRTGSVDIYAISALEQRTNTMCVGGDYHRCIQYAEEGEFICTSYLHGSDSLQFATSFFFWKINALYRLKELKEAERLLYEKIDQLHGAGVSTYDHVLFERMASVKTQLNDFPSAIQNYNRALNADKKNGSYLISLQTFGNMGFYLFFNRLHDTDRAMQSYQNALKMGIQMETNTLNPDSIELSNERMNIYANIANLCIYKKKFDSAAFYFDKSFTIALGSSPNTKWSWSELVEHLNGRIAFYVLNAMIDKAGGLVTQYHQSKIIDTLRQAATIYFYANRLQNRISMQQENFQSRLFWRDNIRQLYEGAIETHFLLNEPENVLYYLEKSRAVLLAEQLKKQQTLHAEEIYRLFALKQKDVALNKNLNGLPPGSPEIEKIRGKIFDNSQELLSLEQSFKNNNRVYYQSLLDTNTVQIKDVQEQLGKTNGMLLEVYNGDSSVYTLALTKNKIYLRRIDKMDFDQTTRDFISTISNASDLNRAHPEFVQTSARLYNILFSEIPLPTGPVTISPDGRYFPFEALITHHDSNNDQFLIQDHAVSYVYSAGFMTGSYPSDKNSSAGNLLGVAPTQYPESFGISALSFSSGSLKKIGDEIDKNILFTGVAATRKNFMQNFQQYKIVQLYTHASDSSSRDEPVIYFADSALYLSELIAENKTSTQLIVLSACETGNGKLFQGEGVFSFNRGFAALGIPSSVINLWSVDDESTYKLTELFYQYVGQGIPLDEALRKAKLDFINSSSKEKKLPYYWAATILAGKTDSVKINPGSSKILIPAITIAIMGIGFAISKRKFFRKKAA